MTTTTTTTPLQTLTSVVNGIAEAADRHDDLYSSQGLAIAALARVCRAAKLPTSVSAGLPQAQERGNGEVYLGDCVALALSRMTNTARMNLLVSKLAGVEGGGQVTRLTAKGGRWIVKG